MIYTEKEAPEKRCTPAIMLRLLDLERYNSIVAHEGDPGKCIGSKCAQWRWYDTVDISGTTFFPIQAPYKGMGGVHLSEMRQARVPGRGYCGLAGRVSNAGEGI